MIRFKIWKNWHIEIVRNLCESRFELIRVPEFGNNYFGYSLPKVIVYLTKRDRSGNLILD